MSTPKNKTGLFLIVLLIGCSISTAFSQQGKRDSLATLVKMDKEDTNKLNHLNLLAWDMMYDNIDTSVLLLKQAIQIANNILADPSNANNNIRKTTTRELGRTYGNLGAIYYLGGDYVTSLQFQFKSLEIRETIKDTNGLTNTYNNIGSVFSSQGNHPQALEYYFKALKLNIATGKTNKVAHNLNNIGLVYNDNHEYDKALEYFNQALFLNQKIKDDWEMANNYNNIGIVYFGKGQHKKAIEYYFKALNVNNTIGNYNESATNLGNIGAIYFKDTNYVKALEYYQQALKMNEELGDIHGMALNLGNIGEIYVLQKKYLEAEKNLLQALKYSEETQTLELIKENNKHLSTLYQEQGKFELSLKHYQLYTLAKDSIFNDSKSKDIGRLEMKHEIEKAEMERVAKEEAERKTELDNIRRRKNLQYSGIVVVLLIIAVLVTVLGFVKVKPAVASGVVFFAFLIFFEFMMILLDPTVNQLSGGEPAYSLLFNAGIAACIFPIHAFFERILKKRLIKEAADNKNH